MNNKQSIFNQAFQLRKNSEFQKAVELYQPFWNENPNQFNEWDGWSFAYCLSKLNRHQEALEICRRLYLRFKTFEILNSLYAKSIYYTQFTQNPLPALSTLKKAVQAMYDLSPPHHPYSFTPRAIFKLIKLLMSQQQMDWKEIEEWLLKMDPDLLDNRPFQMTDRRGKKIELASPLEEWYANRIKVKAGLNQPEQLLEILQTARKKKIKWHYNNDIWFARKEAFAYQQLGQREKAEAILRKIMLQKKDWFLISDLAKVVPDEKEALQLLCLAALVKGKNEMKLNLYESLYLKLKDKPDQHKIAALHLCLIAAIREENNWEVKPALLEEVKAREVNINEQGSSSLILKELTSFWKKIAGEDHQKQRLEGTIDYIFPHGAGGFIKAGKDKYYFITQGIKGEIKTGQSVSFELSNSFDKKKNKPSKMAIKVTHKP